MPLALTPSGVCHAVDAVPCSRLPAEHPHLLLPLPGAPPFRCQHPCGGPCRFVDALPPPPPLPAHLLLNLRLAPTLAALVAEALAGTEPLGTAADEPDAPAHGSLRYYLN